MEEGDVVALLKKVIARATSSRWLMQALLAEMGLVSWARFY
jgi:hypothetical protein